MPMEWRRRHNIPEAYRNLNQKTSSHRPFCFPLILISRGGDKELYESSLIVRKSHQFNSRFFSETFPHTRVLGLSNHTLLLAKKIIGYHIQRMHLQLPRKFPLTYAEMKLLTSYLFSWVILPKRHRGKLE